MPYSKMRVQEMEKHVVISAPYSSMREQDMEEHIVIVGGGIAGPTTALGLNRLGLRSLVLESSENLRITGFAITLMTNAWRALDALGIGNSLREHYPLISRNISKGNVCVAGDALHPMTPDIGQGGCSALEEGVVLAWCLAEALLKKPRNEIQNEEEYERIKKGLEKFAKERRWRSFSLICGGFHTGKGWKGDEVLEREISVAIHYQ
ncbi:hypothetical protein C3L33_22617, partial [Rhododendron williamsianum]